MMLNKRGPKIDYPLMSSMLNLFWFFVSGLYQSCTNPRESILAQYALNFAIKRSCQRQSNA